MEALFGLLFFLFIIAALVVWIGVAIEAAKIAKKKGRSYGFWLFAGLTTGIFGLIAICVIPTNDNFY